jgi:hypothetical protein
MEIVALLLSFETIWAGLRREEIAAIRYAPFAFAYTHPPCRTDITRLAGAASLSSAAMVRSLPRGVQLKFG